MPCRDYQDEPGSVRTEYVDNPETRKRLDNVTALLCGLCSKLKGQELFNHILANDKKLAAWWKDHQEMDRRRIAAERAAEEKKRKAREAKKKKEALAKKALSKLSLEEREALGL
jgi:hypothetical protein